MLSSVNSDGWSAQHDGTPPSLNPLTSETVSRQGFDATGAATTYSETLTITQRVREAYPNQATITAARVALSDYVYATDTILTVANNSTETSPKPVANWIMPHRLVVGNTIELEVIAAHRNARSGKQVACVVFRATDGTNTVTQTVAATAVSNRAGDRNAVVSYKASLDVSTLTAGLITCNAKVYPWIGAAASVLDSADSSVAREFSPRYFLKNTGAKTLYYVKTAANGGNDGTGAGSTNAATASGTPFATILAAINKAHTDLGATSGVDMAEIRIGDDGGTPFVLGSTAATRTQKVAAITITRDPTVARANARVSFGAAAFRPRLGGSITAPLTNGALRFHDVGVIRTGTLSIVGEAAPAQLEVIFDDITYDNGATSNAAMFTNAHGYWYGATCSNMGASTLNASASFEHRIFRGVDITFAAHSPVEGWLIVGSSIERPSQLPRGGRTLTGSIIAFNRFGRIGAASSPLGPVQLGSDTTGTLVDVNGAAVLQNVFEWTSAATGPAIRISSDNAIGSNSHVILHNNTFAGWGLCGRGNIFYDEGTTPRTSKLMSCKGNIHVGVFTKSDVFALNGARQGNWPYEYGVGCQGELSPFRAATALGGNEAQEYPGLGAKFNNVSELSYSDGSTNFDPKFTTPAHTTHNGSAYVAGAGGGTYTVQSGSPAKSMVSAAVLSHDLAGTARTTSNDTAGAYA